MHASQAMNTVTVISSISDWVKLRKQFDAKKTIGFVPTMGNLHQGHQSLCEKARQENDLTIISIFVNPTQFNNRDDFTNYPKSFDKDIALANKVGINYILAPNYTDLYADNYAYKITETDLSCLMEGQHRPGHFAGVLTVVMKLFMLVRPTKAYFGEKDWQQMQLIKNMTKAFHCDLDIVSCPTIRDKNGLALSSRNSRLSEEQYQVAINFPKLLASNKTPAEIKQLLEQAGMAVDYIEEFAERRFGAVKIGQIRLIDNVEMKQCLLQF
ncbi:MAG: pantoate--beta-alanine ligase [Gammaproteobacteria bacterium]|nr:pantoate--beta-alanine ligase [Gammaproteobacteria bacterium]